MTLWRRLIAAREFAYRRRRGHRSGHDRRGGGQRTGALPEEHGLSHGVAGDVDRVARSRSRPQQRPPDPHGSPRKNNEYLLPDRTDLQLARLADPAHAEVVCVEPALRYPNVTLRTHAYVRRLETTADGRRVSKVVVERDGEVETYSADVVVVSAGAINSAALLLRSASDRHPRGLANASDVVGRIVASELETRLGKPVIVLNRPGGGTTIAAKEISAATQQQRLGGEAARRLASRLGGGAGGGDDSRS